MGVRDLQKLLQQKAPKAVCERQTKDYVKYKIAIDTSVLLYQFLTSITTSDGQPLKNAQGEVTSHLVGLLSRCQRFAEAGVTPVFVFDGAASTAKDSELQRRRELKEANEQKAKEALRANDVIAYKKYSSRAVRVDKKIYDQAKKLMDFMGIHYIQAEGEAEVLCVALCNSGLCDAVGSSDLDCVAHGAKLLVRNLATDKPCIEINYQKALEELKLDHNEFIDLCILLGCDYVDRIQKVGPMKALELITKYRSIENAIEEQLKDKIQDKDEYLSKVNQARDIFQSQSILTQQQKQEYTQLLHKKLAFRRQEAIEFLVTEMQFERKNAESRLDKYQKLKAQPKQTTLGSFVKVVKKVQD